MIIMKINTILRIIVVCILIFFMIFVGTFMHELGHYIMCRYYGLKVYKFHVELTSGYVRREHTDNVDKNRMIILMGSVLACIFSIFCILIDYKIKKDFLMFSASFTILGNLIYWFMHVNTKSADPCRFINTFDAFNLTAYYFVLIVLIVLTYVNLMVYVKCRAKEYYK